MMDDARLDFWLTPARRRRFAVISASGIPAAFAIAAVVARMQGMVGAIAVFILALAVVLAIATIRASRHDRNWLVQALDCHRPDMEDSAGLLFRDVDLLGPLERLQQRRLLSRLDEGSPWHLVPPWDRRSVAIIAGTSLVVILAALLWPPLNDTAPRLSPSAEGIATPPGLPRLVAQAMRVVPPAYTGLPPRTVGSLDTRVPAGSLVQWTLRFDPQPRTPRLAVLAGAAMPLRRDGDLWIVNRLADRSFLYRVDPSPGRKPMPPLHRVDAVPDAPPHVKAISPADTLTMITPGQRSWTPIFSATDDYGVAASARLRITLAMGDGENVTFTEREIPVSGSGAPRNRRFAPRLDFSRFGFSSGGDMVVQLIVHDHRAPTPQEVRGPSLILRWPGARSTDSSGLTGMVNTTLPAYFRSQRQIIIDAQSLLRQKRALASSRFLSRSAAIGSDQEILRGRYSQFLGGEQEGDPELPIADADDHGGSDDHDHGGQTKTSPTVFGEKEDVLAEFGHPHDESPASSLDPEVRGVLRKAVDEMWQSERELKTGHPDLALPYAERALRFIKEVQQATRIFLSRVGPELPPIDQGRRMTGKREGIASRNLMVAPIRTGDGAAALVWANLGTPNRPIDPRSLDALETWTRANADRLPDALALGGAIDQVRSDPGCTPCRVRLRAFLWSAMERPAAQASRRSPAEVMGKRYLRAIDRR